MECIHCGSDEIVLPENHSGGEDVPVCGDCDKYQVERGLDLLERRFV